MYHIWDKTFKLIGEKYPKEIMNYVMPQENVKIIGKYEQERIVVTYQIADLNLWIQDGKEQKLVNIEAYSDWNSTIPAKVFTRNGIITKSLQYEYKVMSIEIQTFGFLLLSKPK